MRFERGWSWRSLRSVQPILRHSSWHQKRLRSALGAAAGSLRHDTVCPVNTTPSRSFRLGRPAPDAVADGAVARVQDLTRLRFGLPQEAPVLVSQLSCSNEGCPPLQTVVAFWTDTGERHHFKVSKPIAAIGDDDIPVEWLDDALFTAGASGGGCC